MQTKIKVSSGTTPERVIPGNLTGETVGKVRTVRITEAETLKEMQLAALMIGRANAMESEARKLKEAGKDKIARFLNEERKIDVDALAIGDSVNVENVCLIVGDKQSRFDQKAFALAHADLVAQFTKDNLCLKWKV